jgi:hypothetical protein
MKNATKKTTKKRGVRRPARRESRRQAAAPQPTISAVEPASAPVATPEVPTPALVKPRPTARTYRRLASPAARRGADLVRFLRVHAKRPFGRRGEEAIRRLAVEVGHLGNLELNGD